jgi:putative DNA primase/helicase
MAHDDQHDDNEKSVVTSLDQFRSRQPDDPPLLGGPAGGKSKGKQQKGKHRQRQARQFHTSKNHSGMASSLENAITAIDDLGIECRYDVFHDRILVSGHPDIGTAENLDHVALAVRRLIVDTYGFDPGGENTFNAIMSRAHDNTFDPVLDYLDGLEWDGVARIDRWLHTHLGAEDNKLNGAIGRKMLVAAVKRVLQPGCKFDYIPIMDNSKQGKGKSTVVQILAGPENFSDQELIGLNPQQQQEQIQGVWLYELSELSGLQKTDINKVKSFASRMEDRARPAYGRALVARKRRDILIGTTNDPQYLQDPTGNRRFWPFTPGDIDIEAVRRDRDQLWAEAAAAEATGEALIIPEGLWSAIEERQASRRIGDPWEDLLGDVVGTGWPMTSGVDYMQAVDENGALQWRVKSAALLGKVLGIAADRVTNVHSKRLGAVDAKPRMDRAGEHAVRGGPEQRLLEVGLSYATGAWLVTAVTGYRTESWRGSIGFPSLIIDYQ